MNPEDQARLKALEVRSEFYDRILDRMDRSLEQNSNALQQLVRLEERHQTLDRAAVRLTADLAGEVLERKAGEKEVASRLKKVEEAAGINTHGRDLTERAAIPLATGISGALIMYLFKAAWGD